MTQQEYNEYVEESEDIAGAIESHIIESGIVGLSIALKIAFENTEEAGASKEWMINTLIAELQKNYEFTA